MPLLDGSAIGAYHPPRLRSCEIAGERLAYGDVGEGPVVLYFHGTGTGYAVSLAVEAPLRAAGYRMIVPQRPGYDGTPISGKDSLPRWLELVRQLLERLEVRGLAVIATSGGGPSAIKFIRRWPELVGCVLWQCAQSHPWSDAVWAPKRIAGFLPLARYAPLRRALIWANQQRLRWLQSRHKLCLRDVLGQRWTRDFDDQAASALAKFMIEWALAHPQPAGVAGDLATFFGPAWLHSGEIRAPTLIIHDPLDPLVPIAHARHAHRMIGPSNMMEVKCGGHLVWVGDDAEKMHRARLEFLARHLAHP